MWKHMVARSLVGSLRTYLISNMNLHGMVLEQSTHKGLKEGAHYISQECAHCHHIHSSNRKRQDSFLCIVCGHTDNADKNACNVIKQQAIQLILNAGTELSKRGGYAPLAIVDVEPM